jgi:hypothetical protein
MTRLDRVRGVMGPMAGWVAVVDEAQPTAHNLAGQVQDGGVVTQDEVGVGGQDDAVQLEQAPPGGAGRRVAGLPPGPANNV